MFPSTIPAARPDTAAAYGRMQRKCDAAQPVSWRDQLQGASGKLKGNEGRITGGEPRP